MNNFTEKNDPQSVNHVLKEQFKLSVVSDEEYSDFMNNKDSDDKLDSSVTDTSSDSTKINSNKFNLSSFDDDEDFDISEDTFGKPINTAFDINLAEFPIAYLNRGGLPKNVNKTEISYSDTIKGRNGKPVERFWTVQATAKISGKERKELEKKLGRELSDDERQLGFGGPQTLEVIYELFQLWKEQGFSDSKISVGTYHHLLKRLNWCTGKSDYELLKKTLKCIHGIHIQAERAVYLPKLDKYDNRSFYIFPNIRTYTSDDGDIKPDDYLYINVDQDFYEAVKLKTPFYIPFDRHYFKTLTSMEQKLGLMLAKVFSPYKKKQRFDWKRSMLNLAKQIPITASDKRLIKRQFKRICDGLISKDFPFLSTYSFDNDNIIFYNNIQTTLNLYSDTKKQSKDVVTIKWLIDEQLKICGDKHSIPFYSIIAKYVPVDIIIECLSEAKQEGKVKRKLYTKIIKEKARKYLEPHVSYNKSDIPKIDPVELSKINKDIVSSECDKVDDKVEEIYDDPNF